MPKDFLGYEIKAGCTVAYPTRTGSDMHMNTMRVELVEDGKLKGFNRFGTRLTIRNIKNCIVVQPIEV